jgi:glucoamylase
MRLSGRPFWNHTEDDEIALPVLLLDIARRKGRLSRADIAESWPMCRRAASFLVRSGPWTRRDRWEDTSGLTPFTLATGVAALLVASEMAARYGEPDLSIRFRAVADEWNALIDRELYRHGGVLAEHVGVEGYYVRSRARGAPFPSPLDLGRLPKTEVSPDALALVRFGLRRPDDPRIVNTVAVIDATLKHELAGGPSWRRYSGDEYGEYDDGRPFDGHGVGRCWPILTGERAHYELASGRPDRAKSLLSAIESFATETGMLPEQVWDGAVSRGGLAPGRPTGSAAPLGWAHAEYVLLCRSISDGTVFDMPEVTRRRYLEPGAGR